MQQKGLAPEGVTRAGTGSQAGPSIEDFRHLRSGEATLADFEHAFGGKSKDFVSKVMGRPP